MNETILEKVEDTARRYGVKEQTIRLWLINRNGKPSKIPASAVVRLGNSAKPRIRLIKNEVDQALLHFFCPKDDERSGTPQWEQKNCP